MTTTRIGVVGLGEMGGAIARRLHAQGAPLLVYDANPERQADWPPPLWAPSLPDLAKTVDVILLIVATDQQLMDVVGPLAAHLTDETTLVVHTTVAPATVTAAAAIAEAHGARLIDAGMSRGSGKIIDGSLTLFAGGDEHVVDQARAVFDLYSDNLVYAGALGSGMVVKLCNNLALHGNRVVLLEAARLAVAAGVRAEVMVAGLRTSTGSSWVAHHWGKTEVHALGTGLGTTPMVERTSRELDAMLVLANELQVEVPAAALVTARLPKILESGLDATDHDLLLAHKKGRVAEWRSARDRAGPAFWSPLLVLTTTGAKTGRPRECVLEFMTGTDCVYVFGSNGGRRQDPAWIVNLRTHPRITVEIGPHVVTAKASILDGTTAADIYAQRAATNPAFTRYQAEAGQRPIPVVRIDFDQPVTLPSNAQ